MVDGTGVHHPIGMGTNGISARALRSNNGQFPHMCLCVCMCLSAKRTDSRVVPQMNKRGPVEVFFYPLTLQICLQSTTNQIQPVVCQFTTVPLTPISLQSDNNLESQCLTLTKLYDELVCRVK